MEYARRVGIGEAR